MSAATPNQESQTCCFTGHRHIPPHDLEALQRRLADCVTELIQRGVIYYGCGGALGFDMLAGFTVLRLKDKYPQIKLVMVLPCRDQDARWPAAEKSRYRILLANADKAVYIAERYEDGCMLVRNRHLVRYSGHCVAYLLHSPSGSAHTVRAAQEKGISIINLAR